MSPKLRVGRGATLREQLISLGIIQESNSKPMENNSNPNVGTVTRPPQGGISVDHWFWAAVDQLGLPPGEPKKDPAPVTEHPQVQQDIGQILAENPGIAGATFYNMLKAQGWQFIAPEWQTEKAAEEAKPMPIEADALSSQFVGILAPQKESTVPRGTMKFRARFLEATPRSDNNKHGLSFKCIMLQEGLGNLGTSYYYSKDAITSAVPIFEGKKIYADHPSAVEEEVRPERSVRDVLGHFENVSVEESDDGVSRLVGNVKILPDPGFEWARALMRHSVEYAQKYPDKDFVGLSINAGGDAEEVDMEKVLEAAPGPAQVKLKQAQADGISKVRWVSKITEAVSCDLVTEAGAGGKIVTMLESDKPKEGMDMNKDEMKKEEPKKEEAAPEQDAAPKHDDAAQDVELIKKMIAQYLGNDHVDNEESMNAGKEAVEAAKAIGCEGEEAYKQAGMMMKMAQHMKQKHQEALDKKEEPKKDDACEEAKEEPKKDEPKESAEILKLTGENAALKEKLTVLENEKFLDKLLRESKLPMTMTKKFREALGEKIPSKKEEIEAKFKLFREGAQAAGEGDMLSHLVIQPEKTGEIKGSIDFSDCVK